MTSQKNVGENDTLLQSKHVDDVDSTFITIRFVVKRSCVLFYNFSRTFRLAIAIAQLQASAFIRKVMHLFPYKKDKLGLIKSKQPTAPLTKSSTMQDRCLNSSWGCHKLAFFLLRFSVKWPRSKCLRQRRSKKNYQKFQFGINFSPNKSCNVKENWFEP